MQPLQSGDDLVLVLAGDEVSVEGSFHEHCEELLSKDRFAELHKLKQTTGITAMTKDIQQTTEEWHSSQRDLCLYSKLPNIKSFTAIAYNHADVRNARYGY